MKLGAPPLPTDPSTEEVADWAELVTIRGGKLSRGKLSTEVIRNAGSDTLVADAWIELGERAALAGAHWSFSVASDALTLPTANAWSRSKKSRIAGSRRLSAARSFSA